MPMRIQRFATKVTPKSTNWWLVLGAPAALVGGIYWYTSKSQPTPTPALTGDWNKFKLKEIHKINHNSSTFRFELPAGTTHLGMTIASSVITRYQEETKEDGSPKYVIRPYTPIEDPADGFTGYFDLVVKKYPEGKMSSYIHSLKVGDELEMKGPMLKFPYKANEFEQVGMVAGGTGITPMIQVIQAVLGNSADKTKIHLVFGNLTEDDILMKNYLDKLAKEHPAQFKVDYILDKAPKGSSYLSGYVTDSLLKSTMPAPGKGKVFVCGPPPMVKAICGPKAKDFTQGEIGGLLKSMGYSSDDVFKF